MPHPQNSCKVDSCLFWGVLNSTTVHFQEAFCPLQKKSFLPDNTQLNAMKNISMFQRYFLYIHSDAHCLLAYSACSCHTWVVLLVMLESFPIAHFLVATFKTENILTSVLLSQCSHQGSAPVLLYKYYCRGC